MSTTKKETLVDWYISLQNTYIAKYGPKTLIMMEVGSFYECYAVTDSQLTHLNEACQIMSIRVTRKNNKSGTETVDSGNPYMAGVTSIAFDKYMNMLLPVGYNIVRVDQVTPPPMPKREVVRVYSPGTCNESIMSSGQMDNYLLVIYIEGYSQSLPKLYSIGITLIDLTTGNSYCCEFHDNHKTGHNSLTETYRIVYGYQPVETVIYTTGANELTDTICDKLSLDKENTRVYNDIDDQWRDLSFQEMLMRRHFQCPANIIPHDYLGLGMKLHATISVTLAVQFIYDHDREVAKRLNRPKSIQEANRLVVSYTTMEILDVIPKNNKPMTRKNSLLGLLDGCKTAMGKRLLKNRLLHPTTDVEELRERYNLISLLGKHYEKIINYTKFTYDLDRLHRKMSLANLSPNEFTSLDTTYTNINKIIDCLGEDPELKAILFKETSQLQFSKLNKFMETYRKVLDLDKLAKYSSPSDISTNIFIPGNYLEIDRLCDKINAIQVELDKFRQELCNLTYDGSISKLKADSMREKSTGLVKLEKNDRDGYHFKITKPRSKLLKKNIDNGKAKSLVDPSRHMAIENLKFSDRRNEYVISCNWLDNKSKEMLYNGERLTSLTREVFKTCQRDWTTTYGVALNFISDFLAVIDLSLGNFYTSNRYHYTKPEIVDISDKESSGIWAEEVRHPITERIRTDTTFVANPIRIGSLSVDSAIYGGVITGLNGVGKSIYIKSVALAVLMAQAGLFVAAKKFRISLYNQIFTRIGNCDNLFRGQSTFYREMLELDTILRNSDKNSLVIADELCSGSEQLSAQAILSSTIETLSVRKCSNLITTHFHGCLDLPEIVNLPMVKFYHFLVEYEGGLLVYNRHLVEGLGPKLYGLEVCKHILGEGSFIDRCYEFRHRLQGQKNLNSECIKTSKYNTMVKVTKCEVCGKIAVGDEELHTHHISEQVEADQHGNIGHIDKNTKGNLVVLCREHHHMVHHGGLEITGWKQCLEKGLYLDYHFKKTEESVVNRKKYTEAMVVKVISLQNNGYKARHAKLWLETEGGFKSISTATIRKIWNGTY